MKKMMKISIVACVALAAVACKQTPGKALVKKAADAMNKKDYAAFTALLSKNTLAGMEKTCEPLKAIPKDQVAAVAQASKMPEDVIANCSPAKLMEFGLKQQASEGKEEKYNADKIKSEKQEGNTIDLELDDAQHTKMKLVNEGGEWKIDMSAEFKGKE